MIKRIIVVFILISFITGMTPSLSSAENTKEVKEQISSINEQIKLLDKEIATYKNKIAQTTEEKNSLAKIIKELNLTKEKLLKERTQIEKKIDLTGIVIKELDSNIKTKEGIIFVSEKSISEMFYLLYQEDSVSVLEKILSQNNLESISREYNDKIELSNKLRENILRLKGQKVELTETKLEKLDEQDKLTILKNTLKQKEQAVSITQKEKDQILKETNNKEIQYQKLLKEAEERKQIFEKEMEDYEAQLELLINPNFLPKAGSGVLSWPLDDILITSKFGIRINPFNSSIQTYHYGVDFRASVGTQVKSNSSGTVVDVGNTDIACKGASFGNWVLVKYNNGLSGTYGHLSAISVKKGQKVKIGDVIGLSGGARGVFGSGSSTGPHLHLSIYASDGVEVASFESKSCPGKILTQPRINRANAHLDPLLYLPKTTKDMFK